jgi:enterochelin esterase family protein
MTRRGFLLVVAAVTAGLAGGATAQNLKGDEVLSKVLPEDDGWQLVAEGFGFTDAAGTDAAGDFMFSDLAKGSVHKIGADGKVTTWWAAAPKISGMKFGPDGKLYAATQGPKKQIIVVAPDTKAVTVLAADAQPNDLVVTRKGFVYFTDTSKGTVMVIDPQRKLRVAAGGINKPNGIALTPDGGTLAVSEFGGEHVWAFRVESNGDLAYGSPWMDLRVPVRRTDSGGDGMTVDADGRFYVTSFEGLQMFDWTGRMGGVMTRPGPRPFKTAVSVAFAGADRAYLYLCAGDKIFRRKTKTHGAP